MNLDDIIEYDEEGTNLDFKKEEYKKGNYESLIKDVMSMANAINTEPKRIVIGVEYVFGGKRDIIGLEELTDPAIFENIIQDNIEPTINFRYYPYEFNGKLLGVIEIIDNNDKPYMMKKDYLKLKKGDTWVRKGSRQSQATREDMDRMYEANNKNGFEKKIVIGFGKDLKNSIKVSKVKIKREELPSQKEISRLEGLVKKIDDRYNKEEKTTDKDNTDLSNKVIDMQFNDSDKSIRVGYGGMFRMPIYKNREQLLESIDRAPYDYYYDDCYYYYEKCSKKFNCQIYNDGSEFLEDVKIELFFDSGLVDISEKIYEDTSSDSSLIPSVPQIHHYPKVYCEENTIIVEEEHKQIRHKTLENVFFEDLRMNIKSNIEVDEIEVKYRIGAKNLPNHVEGSFTIVIA